jgi:SpoVK/Ycf46/Vps4 family AAA+-type ATPase
MDLSLLKKMFASGHVCVRLVTFEEAEAAKGVRAVARELGLPLVTWSAVQGLREHDANGSFVSAIEQTENAAAALFTMSGKVSTSPCVILMMDLAEHLTEARTVRALRELVEKLRAEHAVSGDVAAVSGTPASRLCARVVLLDHKDEVPPVVGFLSSRVDIPLPDDEELDEIVRDTLRTLNRQHKYTAKLTAGDLRRLIESLRGMTRRQAAQLVADATAANGTFTSEDLESVLDSKRRLLADTGVLEHVDAPMSLDSIGGLSKLKAWLKAREVSFTPRAKALGLTPPRGVLLLGVQGAGKSLAAKAIATAWKRPLMRLDPGTLYDRYIGESETRLREALRQSEAMAPIVLWIDEIEKGFSGASSTNNSDGGLSRRMFGTMLTWMQEHKAPVFLVATANDIEALPPELLRKGRFDEIFFVDLPSAEVRETIFNIHLKKRRHDHHGVDVRALAQASEGFSGAEIEQAIIASLHNMASTWQGDEAPKLRTQDVLEVIRNSPPLSVTMSERLEDLREWASGRCVPAD